MTNKAEQLLCTCGRFYGLEDDDKLSKTAATAGSPTSTTVSPDASQLPLGASFVHLPPSMQVAQDCQTYHHHHHLFHQEQHPQQKGSRQSSSHVQPDMARMVPSEATGFLANAQQVMRLEQALFCSNFMTNPDEMPELCWECIQRVERALDWDSDRMDNECLLYHQAMERDESRHESWTRALQVAGYTPMEDDFDVDDNTTTTTATATTTDHAGSKSLSCQNEPMDRARQMFQDEIAYMHAACQQQEEELSNLQQVYRDQLLLARQLDDYDDWMEQERNALELEARAFDNDQEQLYRILLEIQNEAERLSSSQIRLPSLLLQVTVDQERGLRYPLINQLRLAYRPKGDVRSYEIQASWALAAHLLLIVGTLFEFQSSSSVSEQQQQQQHQTKWKIIPLSHCAKLIRCRRRRRLTPVTTTTTTTIAVGEVVDNSNNDTNGSTRQDDSDDQKEDEEIVYNLGHPGTNAAQALLAYHELMHEIIVHVHGKMKEVLSSGCGADQDELSPPFIIPPIPFLSISATQTGDMNLTDLDENDDASWSHLIHYMASNLLWLSECASIYIRHEVLWNADFFPSDDV